MKELRSPLGNKPLTQFTVAELMQATFLHTFAIFFTNLNIVINIPHNAF